MTALPFLMRVEFEFTQEELMDVHWRALKRSKAVASFRRREWLYFSLIWWVFAFVIFFGKGMVVALSISALSALIAAGLYPAIHQIVMESRLRKLFREKLDPKEPLVCEVELTPAGVWVRHAKTQTTYEWECVEAINLSEGDVEIIAKSGGVMVRSRAFESEDDRQQFLHLANSYLQSAAVSNR